MRLFARLTFKITLILFIHRSDGFMFSAWWRGTKEHNTPTRQLAPYKHQGYNPNEAYVTTTQTTATGTTNRFDAKKDSGKGNVGGAIWIGTGTGTGTGTPFNRPQTDRNLIGAYNNQRTGISAPAKYEKNWNAFDAIPISPHIRYIHIPAAGLPYFLYYDDETKAAAQQAQNLATYATTIATQKSVRVELNYKDDAVVEKSGENVVLNRKLPSAALDSVFTSTQSSPSPSPSPSSSTTFSSSEPDSSSKLNSPQNPAPLRLLGPANWYYVGLPSVAHVRYISHPSFKSPPMPAPMPMVPLAYKNAPRGVVSERWENFTPVNAKAEKPFCDNCFLPPLPSVLPVYPPPHTMKTVDVNNLQKPCTQPQPQQNKSASTTTPTSSFKLANWFTY